MDLVTGATGIVGGHVLLECALRGPVRAIYRQGCDRSIVERLFRHYHPEPELALENVHWVEADLLDVVAMDEAMTGIQRVYHAAAMVSFAAKDADAMWRMNVIGTANVVNAALRNGAYRLCHVSSTAAIGEAPEGAARDERSPWDENARASDYSRTKYAAELEVQRGIAEGLEAIMVNPCIVIGPGRAGRSSMTLVERLQKGTRFYPRGSNAVVDARDVARAMTILMERGGNGERYLLVGENLSYRRLFTLLTAAFNRPEPTIALKPWWLSLAWRLEHLRTRVLGGTPFITSDTAQSALSHRSYDASKAKAVPGITFRSAQEAVDNVADFVKGRSVYSG